MKFLYSFLIIVIVAGLIIFGLFWYSGGSDGPSINFSGPENVYAGVPFDLEVGVSNDSGQILRDAKISLSLPAGVVLVGGEPGENLISKSVGNLGIGSLTSEVFRLIAITDDSQLEESKKITAKVSYSPESIDSQFEKSEEWLLKIAGSAIELNIKFPDSLTSGKEVGLEIFYKNAGGSDLENLTLIAEYPKEFKFEKATVKPDEGDNKWELGGLRKGSENNITVIGKVIGPENGFFSFKFKLETKIGSDSYLISQQTVNSTISVAPLSLEVLTNGIADYSALAGESLNYVINYDYLDFQTNGTATIKAGLEGEMFDFSTLSAAASKGSVQPDGKTVVWRLRDLPRSGSANFTIKTKGQYPIQRLGDRNFILKTDVTMDDGQYVAVASAENKVIGRLVVDAKAYFRDAESGIINLGPFPPLADQPTSYTIHWLVTNYSTDVKNAVVRARLEPGVKFTGTVTGSGGIKPYFNQDTNEMVWEAGRISATKGIASSPLEAIFQIKAVPPAETLGRFMPLLQETEISGIDEFTGTPLSYSDSSLSTQLSDDKTISGSDGMVR